MEATGGYFIAQLTWPICSEKLNLAVVWRTNRGRGVESREQLGGYYGSSGGSGALDQEMAKKWKDLSDDK